ncbi:MAG: HAD family hydrolase [Candidatus Methanomethylicaceae archaeon]
MRLAVVFDKSGTILNPCRVVFDIKRNELLFHITTLRLVVELGGYLVNVRGTSAAIRRGSRSLDLKISCAASPELPRIDKELLRRGGILDALKKVLFEAERHCGSEVGACAALIINKQGEVTHAVGLGGRLYEDVKRVVEAIKRADDDVFIATGNCRETTLKCAELLGIPKSFVLHDASPKEKMEFVKMLKGFYGVVVMVGNDVNDLMAMREADVSIFVNRDDASSLNSMVYDVDYILNSLNDLPRIISEIKGLQKSQI